MTSENSQMASSALQICRIRGFIDPTTSGWHCGEGSATDRASTTCEEGEVSAATTRTESREKATEDDGRAGNGLERG